MIYSVFSELEQDSFAFKDGLLPSLVCILIVFLVLTLLTLILSILNRVKALDVKEVVKPAPTPSKGKAKLEDITDDDMMAAVLVATIDYREEVKTDIELISVKQIG